MKLSPVSRPIRIVLIDDHSLVREGLEGALQAQPDLNIAASFSSGTEALQRLPAIANVDVILLDLRMPDSDGIDIIPRLRKHHPAAAIVMLSSDGRQLSVQRALAAGANGFLLKSMRLWDLIDSVRHVARGGRLPLSAELTPASALSASTLLTSKELCVLRHLARGLSNEQIAEAMSVSVNTVKTHVARVLSKLEAESRTDAVVRAAQIGLVDV